MRIELGFGDGTQTVAIPDENYMGSLLPNAVEPGPAGDEAVRRALAEPIGSPPLRSLARPGERIAIVTSDITRPMPTARVIPALLEELYAAGVSPGDITLVFALGSHRKHTQQERAALAGPEATGRIRCVDSDPDDCVRIGVTRRGTPVDITRAVARADRRICLGNIEYHYFAGYSGGAKAIMPGASTREAIQHNHRLMTDERACAGAIAGNPVREDIEEAAALCGVDFILNVVLDEHKRILRAVAGDVTLAHRAGCAFLDRLYMKEIPRRADIVLASQGGAPKDINLYQTQKALDNARHAVKDGGTIILVGSCREGMGEPEFERWMTQSPSPESMIERIGRDFRLGGHKAAAIAMVLRRAGIFLVSEMDPALVRRMFMTPFARAQDALDAALRRHGAGARVLVMPYAGSTLPRVG